MTSINPRSEDIQTLSKYYDCLASNRRFKAYFPNNSTHYKPTSTFLGVSTKDGEARLMTVKKSDIGFINLFLRIFGYGKLAHIDFSLKTVSSYLEKFKWSIIKNNGMEAHDKAFKSVCAIANRWARHSPSRRSDIDGNTRLLDSLSQEQEIGGWTFKINLETEVCDLGNQIRRKVEAHLQYEKEQNTRALKTAFRNLTRNAEEPVPAPIESDRRLITAQIRLQGLDRDNDAFDRSIVPLTRIQLNDGKILSSHALIPSELNTINKIQFITRSSDIKTAQEIKEGLDTLNPNLTAVIVEKYQALTKQEDDALLSSFVRELKRLPS